MGVPFVSRYVVFRLQMVDLLAIFLLLHLKVTCFRTIDAGIDHRVSVSGHLHILEARSLSVADDIRANYRRFE